MSTLGLLPLRHWLERHHEGDPGAREEVLRLCQAELKRLVDRSLGRFPKVRGREESCDICQNVLIRLDRMLRSRTFGTEGAFLRVISRIVQRELIDQSRKRWVRTVNADAEESTVDEQRRAELSDFNQDPYTLARWDEVHVLIAALPEADRRLFDLLYYEGLTQPQAAKRLRISLRTLKRNWHYARARFRLALGNDSLF